MKKSLFFIVLALAVVVLAGQGCVINPFASTPAKTEGGVYKSLDKGETWGSAANLWTLGAARNFKTISFNEISLDPQDHNAVYAASAEGGLFYSYNAGAGWFQPEQIKGGSVTLAAIDPRNKCNIYAVIGGLILQSLDCNRTYGAIYQETRSEVAVRTLAIDYNNSNIIYAGNSAGDVLKSTDRGHAWVVIKRWENSVEKIIINPLNTNILYLATSEKGIYRSGDAGANWTDLNQGLKQYAGAYTYCDLLLMDAKAETLLLSSQYGLIKSGDAGLTWTALNLLTPPGGADIKVVAVNPKNSNEIFYATPLTFYKSADGGVKWETKKLPSTRVPATLLIDPVAPSVFYLGFAPVKK